MCTVTGSEERQTLSEVIEAARRGPVVIQRQKRDVAVVMSMEEYERLFNLNVAELRRFCDQVAEKAAEAGVTEEVFQGLLSRNDS